MLRNETLLHDRHASRPARDHANGGGPSADGMRTECLSTSPDASPPTAMFPHDASTAWWLSGQIDLIAQAHDAFSTPYSGPHSFLATPERTLSRVLTLYTGLRLGHGWEAFFDVESAGGNGLSDALGLAGFTDLDVVRNPTLGSSPYLARLMIRKVIAFSRDEMDVTPTPLALASHLPTRRLEIRAGKLGIVDFFDVNAVGNDSHVQFTNWTVDNKTARTTMPRIRRLAGLIVVRHRVGPRAAPKR